MRGSMREQTTAMPYRDDDDDDALLLCGEDAGELLERGGDSGRPCWAGDTAGFGEQQLVPEECCYPEVSAVTRDAACSPAAGCPGRPRSGDDRRPAGWTEYVSWILKARSYHGFQPATAYLAVSYMDRFLSSSGLPKPSS